MPAFLDRLFDSSTQSRSDAVACLILSDIAATFGKGYIPEDIDEDADDRAPVRGPEGFFEKAFGAKTPANDPWMYAKIPREARAAVKRWQKDFCTVLDKATPVDDLHITLFHSLQDPAEDRDTIDRIAGNTTPRECELGVVREFPCKKGIAVVVEVNSTDLLDLREQMAGAVRHNPSEHAFRPHITIAYVQAGTEVSLDGMQIAGVTGREFVLSSIYVESGEKARRVPLIGVSAPWLRGNFEPSADFDKAAKIRALFGDDFPDNSEPKDGDGDGYVRDGQPDEAPATKAQESTRALSPKDDYAQNGIRSAAFKSWFGDWENNPEQASKVVDADGKPQEQKEIDGEGSEVADEDGKPIVVYHGTPRGGFEEFNAAKLNDPESLLYGPGFYFTENESIAEEYSENARDPAVYSGTREELEREAQRQLQHMESVTGYQKSTVRDFREAYEKLKTGAELDPDSEWIETLRTWMPMDFVESKWKVPMNSEVKAVYLSIKKPFDIDTGFLPFGTMSKESRAVIEQRRDSIIENLRAYQVSYGENAAKAKIEADAALQELRTLRGPDDLLSKMPPQVLAEAVKSPDFAEQRKMTPQQIKLWNRYRQHMGEVRRNQEVSNGYAEKIRTEKSKTGATYDELRQVVKTKTEIRKFLETEGYDGLTHIGGVVTGGRKHRVWIAFEPTQVKAVGNDGTFDPKNPNMYKSWLDSLFEKAVKQRALFGDDFPEISDHDRDGMIYDGTAQERLANKPVPMPTIPREEPKPEYVGPRRRQFVEMERPIVGPSGSAMVSYEWRWMYEYDPDLDEEKRVSDWNEAEDSDDTGRRVVHVFGTVDKDGVHRVMSLESAMAELGYIDRKSDSAKLFTSLAAALKKRAFVAMRLEMETDPALKSRFERELKEADEAVAKHEKLALDPNNNPDARRDLLRKVDKALSEFQFDRFGGQHGYGDVDFILKPGGAKQNEARTDGKRILRSLNVLSNRTPSGSLQKTTLAADALMNSDDLTWPGRRQLVEQAADTRIKRWYTANSEQAQKTVAEAEKWLATWHPKKIVENIILDAVEKQIPRYAIREKMELYMQLNSKEILDMEDRIGKRLKLVHSPGSASHWVRPEIFESLDEPDSKVHKSLGMSTMSGMDGGLLLRKKQDSWEKRAAAMFKTLEEIYGADTAWSTVEKSFDEAKHKRAPKGSDNGGQFVDKEGGMLTIETEDFEKFKSDSEKNGYVWRIQSGSVGLPQESENMWADAESSGMGGVSGYANDINAVEDILFGEEESLTGMNYASAHKDPVIVAVSGDLFDGPGAETIAREAVPCAVITKPEIERVFLEVCKNELEIETEGKSVEEVLDEYDFDFDKRELITKKIVGSMRQSI